MAAVDLQINVEMGGVWVSDLVCWTTDVFSFYEWAMNGVLFVGDDTQHAIRVLGKLFKRHIIIAN